MGNAIDYFHDDFLSWIKKHLFQLWFDTVPCIYVSVRVNNKARAGLIYLINIMSADILQAMEAHCTELSCTR